MKLGDQPGSNPFAAQHAQQTSASSDDADSPAEETFAAGSEQEAPNSRLDPGIAHSLQGVQHSDQQGQADQQAHQALHGQQAQQAQQTQQAERSQQAQHAQQARQAQQTQQVQGAEQYATPAATSSDREQEVQLGGEADSRIGTQHSGETQPQEGRKNAGAEGRNRSDKAHSDNDVARIAEGATPVGTQTQAEEGNREATNSSAQQPGLQQQRGQGFTGYLPTPSTTSITSAVVHICVVGTTSSCQHSVQDERS